MCLRKGCFSLLASVLELVRQYFSLFLLDYLLGWNKTAIAFIELGFGAKNILQLRGLAPE